MDLIGSILSIEHRLGRRKPSQGKSKSAQKHICTEIPDEKTTHVDEERHIVPEYDAYIGRIVDTKA